MSPYVAFSLHYVEQSAEVPFLPYAHGGQAACSLEVSVVMDAAPLRLVRICSPVLAAGPASPELAFLLNSFSRPVNWFSKMGQQWEKLRYFTFENFSYHTFKAMEEISRFLLQRCHVFLADSDLPIYSTNLKWSHCQLNFFPWPVKSALCLTTPLL